MRHSIIAATMALTAVAAAFASGTGFAQGQSQTGLPNFKPPPMAPVKPYQTVAVTLPKEFKEPSFVAFRKQLGEIAEHKDKAALGKIVVGQGFFWMQDKDVADKKKSGVDNLVNALDLDAKAFEALINATKTQPPEWGYPMQDGVEVHSADKPDAPVIEKLGITLVRVLADNTPPEDPNKEAFLHIATPSGKAGYVPLEAMSSLGTDQLCYSKEGGGWKITGFFGGAAQ
jgi:hypothetical protein